MTRPVPNLGARLVNAAGFLIPPWNAWFQQFSQNAPAAVTVTANPYTPNKVGNVFISAAATGSTLTRGSTVITFAAGQRIIPVSIGDIVAWTGPAVVNFLET